MDIAVKRQPTSFRIRTDILKALRERAERSNRSLNNYVECLFQQALNSSAENFDDEVPNATTIAAMRELEATRNDPNIRVFHSVEEGLAYLQQ